MMVSLARSDDDLETLGRKADVEAEELVRENLSAVIVVAEN